MRRFTSITGFDSSPSAIPRFGVCAGHLRITVVLGVMWMTAFGVAPAHANSTSMAARKSNERASRHYFAAGQPGTVRLGHRAAIYIPPDALQTSGWVSISQRAGHPFIFKIDAEWSGNVRVTLRLRGKSDRVIHKVGGRWLTEGAGPGHPSAWVTRLSPFTTLSSRVGQALSNAGDSVKSSLCITETVAQLVKCLTFKGLDYVSGEIVKWIEARLPQGCVTQMVEAGVTTSKGGKAKTVIAILVASQTGECVGQAGEVGYHFPRGPAGNGLPGTSGGSGNASSSIGSSNTPGKGGVGGGDGDGTSVGGSDSWPTQITPITSTTGPVGYNPGISGPACENDDGSSGRIWGQIDDQGWFLFDAWSHGGGWSATFPTSGVLGVTGAGTHRATFKCESDRPWDSDGFEFTLTGSAVPTQVSNASPTTRLLETTSGAEHGPTPCPSVDGRTATALWGGVFDFGDSSSYSATIDLEAASNYLSISAGAKSGTAMFSVWCEYGASHASFNFAPIYVQIP